MAGTGVANPGGLDYRSDEGPAMNDLPLTPEQRTARDRNRMKGFALHLMIYFIVVFGCALLNHVKTPGDLWFIYPMVAWGAPLALHAAWVMGLLDVLDGRK
jgi:hypothetical protein